MTEIGYYRYEGVDLRTKFGWINGAPGARMTEPARVGLGNLGNAFASSDQAIRDLIGPLGLEWRGSAADATATALAQAARRGGDTAVANSTSSSAVDAYGQSFEALRPRIAWEDPGEWDWWDMLVDGAGLMAQVPGLGFSLATGQDPDPFELPSDHMRTLEQNRTLDAQANEALYGHEQQARDALARFPVVEQAGPAPLTSASAGIGAGAGAGGFGEGPRFPGGAPAAGADVTGLDRPTVASGTEFGAGLPSGPPDIGPVSTAPAATGLPPGGTALPPGGAGQGQIGAGQGPIASGGGLPPSPIPDIPISGAAGGGTVPHGAAPGGVGGVIGSVGGTPEPAVYSPIGRGFPSVAGDRSGVSREPGRSPLPNGPGRGVSTGDGPGGRLATGATTGATVREPGQSGAGTSGAGGPNRGSVPGSSMPYMGGMTSGAANQEEHRTKYWIPSSEAFDVDLPPHTVPILEGGPE